MPRDAFHDRERAAEAAYFGERDAALVEKIRARAKLSEIALHHPVFKELVREEREIIMPINEHRAYVLRTTNRLLGRIPGVQGVKTGFTSKAGRCLIAKVSQDGSDLLLVILNSKRRWNTATSLINYGLRLSDSRTTLAR